MNKYVVFFSFFALAVFLWVCAIFFLTGPQCAGVGISALIVTLVTLASGFLSVKEND